MDMISTTAPRFLLLSWKKIGTTQTFVLKTDACESGLVAEFRLRLVSRTVLRISVHFLKYNKIQ